MEEIYEIQSYFPLKVSDPTLSKYIDHHLNHLIKCTDNNLFASAYSHLHILYMVFVYIQILRISKEKKEEFNYCWIGFPGEERKFLKNPSSPFPFAEVKEKSVFRFFRLIGFDDGTIGNISNPVNTRNNRLHAKGEIFFEEQDDFSLEFQDYINKMNQIVHKQEAFLKDIYDSLIDTYEMDYQFTNDDLESDFADQYYFSEYELKMLSENENDIVSNFINEEI